MRLVKKEGNHLLKTHINSCKVKVGLQLYKIQEDSYLLDIRKVDGDVLPFMDVCALLLGELKL